MVAIEVVGLAVLGLVLGVWLSRIVTVYSEKGRGPVLSREWLDDRERGTGNREPGSQIGLATDLMVERLPVAGSGLPGCLFPVPRSPLY
jgi:hypothetical protein